MDDFVLNVRQLTQFPEVKPVPSDQVLIQRGLGGPYLAPSLGQVVLPFLVPLQEDIEAIDSHLTSLDASIVQINEAMKAGFETVEVRLNELEADTQTWIANLAATSVRSFNGRVGQVTLNLQDILKVGGLTSFSPELLGTPTTPSILDFDSRGCQIANAYFVQNAITTQLRRLLSTHPFVWTFNARYGNIKLELLDITRAGGAPIRSPNFAGEPLAPTPPTGDYSTRIATTAFVYNSVFCWVDQAMAEFGRQLELKVDDELQWSLTETSNALQTQFDTLDEKFQADFDALLKQLLERIPLYTGPEPPAHAQQGDLWFDTSTNTMMVYNNGAWEAAIHNDFLPLAGGQMNQAASIWFETWGYPNGKYYYISPNGDWFALGNQENYVIAIDQGDNFYFTGLRSYNAWIWGYPQDEMKSRQWIESQWSYKNSIGEEGDKARIGWGNDESLTLHGAKIWCEGDLAVPWQEDWGRWTIGRTMYDYPPYWDFSWDSYISFARGPTFADEPTLQIYSYGNISIGTGELKPLRLHGEPIYISDSEMHFDGLSLITFQDQADYWGEANQFRTASIWYGWGKLNFAALGDDVPFSINIMQDQYTRKDLVYVNQVEPGLPASMNFVLQTGWEGGAILRSQDDTNGYLWDISFGDSTPAGFLPQDWIEGRNFYIDRYTTWYGEKKRALEISRKTGVVTVNQLDVLDLEEGSYFGAGVEISSDPWPGQIRLAPFVEFEFRDGNQSWNNRWTFSTDDGVLNGPGIHFEAVYAPGEASNVVKVDRLRLPGAATWDVKPATPSNGELWYDRTTGMIEYHHQGTWHTMARQ